MRITTNGKELKEAITICRLRGKYNEGVSNALSVLCDDIMLQVKDGMLYVQNADNYTYIVYRLECSESTNGVISISGSTLNKYLTDTDVTLESNDSSVELTLNNSIVTIPLLERHSNSGVITRLKEYLMELDKLTASKIIRAGGEVQVTPKLSLSTILKLESEEFVEAMSLAENVGNCIYKLDWSFDNDTFLISSDRGNEKVVTEIEPISTTGGNATVEISLPIGNIAKTEDVLIVAFNDDVPVVFINEKITVLRGPRDR